MLQKVFLIILCYFLLGFEVSAQTNSPKIGPPYPEIWGYDFSNLPSIRSGGTFISAFQMDDGDIWFLILKSDKQKRSSPFVIKEFNQQWMLLKFFKNEKRLITKKQYSNFCKMLREKKVYRTLVDEKLLFGNGSTLEMGFESFAWKRFAPDFYCDYFIKTDKDNRQEKYAIVGIPPSTDLRLDGGPGDEVRSGPFFYDKIDMFYMVVPLKDDTFLVYSEGSGLILRFDKNLNTHFKPVNSVKIKGNVIPRNFFVVPYSVIEQFKFDRSNELLFKFQSIQDALLGYFCNLYRN